MARIVKNTRDQIFRKERGWGYELWIENLPEYCGKVLHITKGKRGSLHFHVDKLETMFLVKGLVDLVCIDASTGKKYTVRLEVGDSIRIPRAQVHQIVGVEESDLIEFSTIHSETDSYRVKKGD